MLLFEEYVGRVNKKFRELDPYNEENWDEDEPIYKFRQILIDNYVSLVSIGEVVDEGDGVKSLKFEIEFRREYSIGYEITQEYDGNFKTSIRFNYDWLSGCGFSMDGAKILFFKEIKLNDAYKSTLHRSIVRLANFYVRKTSHLEN